MTTNKHFKDTAAKAVADYFKSKGFKTDKTHPYILPDEEWGKNILEDDVYKYVKEEKERRSKLIGDAKDPLPLNPGISNGLSSQAYLFNLVGPLVKDKRWDIFKKIFAHDTKAIINEETEIKFEYSNLKFFKETGAQPTSFDLALINKNATSIFIEAKFTETDFGKCSAKCNRENYLQTNKCYLKNTKNRTYWDRMRGDDYDLECLYKDKVKCPFATQYQFFREILFTKNNNGIFYLLYDNRSPAFINEKGTGKLEKLLEPLPDSFKKITKSITSQEILGTLRKEGCGWVDEFERKYRL